MASACIDVVRRAGGDASSRVEVFSLQEGGYNHSALEGPQVSAALLATHLNGERLNLDHGYPLRLISPNRPGVLNTKWLRRLEVTLMRPYRIALGVAGGLLLAFGIFRLVTELDTSDLVALVLWLAVAVGLHDFVIAPLTVGTGVVLSRVPPRARRYLQGGLVVAAMITVIAIPLIGRRGTQPEAKAILLRDYAGNLFLLLGLTAAVSVVLYAARVLRDGRTSAATTDR